MAATPLRVYEARLVCAGPDGEPECGPVRDGLCTDDGTLRVWEFDAYECPRCGRTDGFAVEAGRRITPLLEEGRVG